MNLKQTLTGVTSEVFSTLCFASPVWLTPVLGKIELKEVEKLHFKTLQIVVRDFKQRINRTEISRKTNILQSKLWMRLSAASMLMKIWNNNAPANLRSSAVMNTFKKNCYEGLLFGFDHSSFKVGKQITKNWCSSVLAKIKVPWALSDLNKVRIRDIY